MMEEFLKAIDSHPNVAAALFFAILFIIHEIGEIFNKNQKK